LAYIELDPTLPGILGLLDFRPETALPLGDFTQTLLRGPSPLSSAERELIAAHVSRLNECAFCFQSHAAAAGALLGTGLDVLDALASGAAVTPLSPKLSALLVVAGKVAQGGRAVAAEDIATARSAGATDLDLHDTVLIAAAFCMFNRYVDGLGTFAPPHKSAYLAIGQRLAEHGYVEPSADSEPGASSPAVANGDLARDALGDGPS
jgi:uncharacterized peroxidase-related enzyme